MKMHPCLVRILHDSRLVMPSEEARERVAGLLAPFCTKTDSGVFGLSPKKDVSEQCVVGALHAVTGVTVNRVGFVSVSHAFETKPETDRVLYWDRMVHEHPFDLRHAIWARSPSLESLLGEETAFRLNDVVWRAIGEPL